MTLDLQQVPCYDSTECKEIYNCAPTTSIYTCPNPNPPSTPTEPKCPNNQTHSNCFGSDSRYCSGIYQQCNDGYYCLPNVSNPALNYFSEYLGCDVKNDPGCLEFESNSVCQSDCWDLGGSKEVKEICDSHFKDANTCNAMKYFCKWDDINKSCTSVKEDPWSLLSKNAPQSAGVPKAVFSEIVNGYNLSCAKSSWSSTDITSYADTIRTCCIQTTDGKKCLTTPRCQFVESPCECGFKDIDPLRNPSYNANPSYDANSVKQPWFICEDTKQTAIVGSNTFFKNGYCTWCKGTQLQNFDYRKWKIDNQLLSPGEDIRTSDAWGTVNNCTNRCSNYNKCENDESEILWNECIWRHSKGTVGVDPELSDLSKGFCYSDKCLENAVTQVEIDRCNTLTHLKNVCENELGPIVSTLNQLYPLSPDGNITNRCSEGTSWTHNCIQANNTTVAENYACGWCPNLQNDWPDNPCPISVPTPVPTDIPANWFAPLSILGVTDQITGGIAVFLIILFGLIIIVGGVFLGRWLSALKGPQRAALKGPH